MQYTNLKETTTFNELIDALLFVTAKLQSVRANLKLPSNDARQVALYGIQQTTVSLALTVHAITGNGLRERVRTVEEVQASFQGLAGFEGETAEQMITIVASQWRWGLLSVAHFKLDSLFQNLLRALGVATERKGFGSNMSKLFKAITLKDGDRDREILDAITHTRNAMHNNGIHRGKDWGPVTIHGLTFEFSNGQPPTCASFGHLLAALDETSSVVQHVLSSDEIRSIEFVEDRYVTLNNT